MKNQLIILLLGCLMFGSSCAVYQNQWVKSYEVNQKKDLPSELKTSLNGNMMVALAINSPGLSYRFDIGEKDTYYDHQSGNFILDSVFIEFKSYLKSNKCLVDVTFKDKARNYYTVRDFDIFKLIHRYETKGDLLYAETIEEEFNRFGMDFRREFGEFTVSQHSDEEFQKVLSRVIRLGITNNCLEPTKWEISITTEDFSDWRGRKNSDVNFNQKRTLSHGWFYMDANVYSALTKLKNPEKAYDYPEIVYDSASAKAEATYVEFSDFRHSVKSVFRPRMIEVGHKSSRILEPVDMEEHYKWEYGLVLNKQRFSNYRDVLETPVELARFTDQGFYNPETPNIYDYSFLKYIDKVELRQINTPETDTYFEVCLTGAYAPYEITLGNLDLATLDYFKLKGHLFGFNTYPKGRRYNHSQNTTSFDPDTYPDYLLKQYLVMTDKNTGKYLNNQKKGVEKLYIGYEDANKTKLVIYLLSYERILPVWMARVNVPTPVYRTVAAKKNLY